MNIVNLDHIVLTVRDIANTVEFYESVLGMSQEIYDDGRIALKFGNQKINLHEYGKETEPKASQPIPGSEDLCFITDTRIEVAMESVKSKGIYILEGPVKRTGATGSIISFYFRDPDGNLIEIANYVEGT
jgi:catechol 2,3-dioxygenase-like lactoylglutathione lyase family enzyme